MALQMGLSTAKMAFKEALTATVVEGGTQSIHVAPIYGQVISMGVGSHRIRKRMLKMLNAAAEQATAYRQGIWLAGSG